MPSDPEEFVKALKMWWDWTSFMDQILPTPSKMIQSCKWFSDASQMSTPTYNIVVKKAL